MLAITACDSDDDSNNEYVNSFNATLSENSEGWQSGFADYPQGGESEWELTATPEQSFTLADGSSAKGFYLHSSNKSDDTQMYITYRIDDLKPNTHFNATFDVRLATNVNNQCAGIGGSPHAVTVKAGLTTQAITSALDDQNHYRINADFGQQTQSGLDGIALGDISENSLDSCDPSSEKYAIKQLTNTDVPFEVSTDSQGVLWLTLMTDSGFEGSTSIYFTAASVTFNESDKSVDSFTETIDFSQKQSSVSAIFFDYPIGREFDWELMARERATVKDQSEQDIVGYLLHSYNRSDDTGMLLFKPVKGLSPNTEYQADFNVTIASNVNDQCFGIGGAPHAVAVKAGLSLTKPEPIIVSNDNHYRLNVDFGNNMRDSENSVVLGDIGVESLADCDPSSSIYALKSFTSTEVNDSVNVLTNNSGVVYFSMLTDSGFEGATTMLFTNASVTFTKL